jgi:hypothetical protein
MRRLVGVVVAIALVLGQVPVQPAAAQEQRAPGDAPAATAAPAPPSATHDLRDRLEGWLTRPRVERDRSSGVMEPMNSSERQAYACMIAGGASLLAVQLVDAGAAVATITGGPVLAFHPVLLWSALTGTLFASVCAAAALMAPGVIRLWDYYYYGMRPSAHPTPVPAENN